MIFRSKKTPAPRLFPHPMERSLARMPHDQRFEVTWSAPLGPWTKGDVIERHVDLIGAHLPTLLRLGAIKPTTAPAKKHPKTIANLQARVIVNQWKPEAVVEAVQDAGGVVTPGQAKKIVTPIAGAPSPTNPVTVIIPGR